MRFAAFILGSALTLFGVTAHAHAAALFNEGPGTTNFSVFPGWQRVMAEARLDIAYKVEPHPSSVPPALSNPPAPPLMPANTVATPAPTACTENVDCLINRWKAFIAATAKLPRDKQLDAVNRWVNAHAYVEDWASWGLPDYWESPREFLARGGDCEDFAIVKYFTLIQLGFSADNMRIMIVNDTNLEIFHAVLAVRQTKSAPILLDNQAKDLVPIAAAPQYHLIYSLNEHGWWMANAPTIMISSRNVASEIQSASGSAD